MFAPSANATNFPSYIQLECDNFSYLGSARKDIKAKWVTFGWDENTKPVEMITTYYHLPDGNVLLNVSGNKNWQSFINSHPVILNNCKIKKEESNS